MAEMRSLTLNGKTYDCFVDPVARALSESVAIISSASGEGIAVSDSSEHNMVGLSIYGRSTQGGTPAPDAPIAIESVGDDGSIVTSVCGRNLIPYPYKEPSPKTSNGMTFRVQSDGGITVSGTPTVNASFILYKGALMTRGVFTVSMSGNVQNAQLEVVLFNAENVTIEYLSTGAKSYVIDAADYPTAVTVQIAIKRSADNVSVSGTAYFQCELGNVVTPYAPYSKQTITVNGPLRAVPVSNEVFATYTDSKGKKWSADVIDLGRGVRIQRVGVFTFSKVTEHDSTGLLFTLSTNSVKFKSYENTDIICDSYVVRTLNDCRASDYGVCQYGQGLYFRNKDLATLDAANAHLAKNPITILAELETPIEKPLTSVEIEAYKSLHTNRLNTTVINDSGAHLSMEYVADTKTYLDKMIVGSPARLTNVTLKSSAWKTESDGLHSQVVTVAGVTEYSKVDLLPSVEQLAIFHNKDVTFVTENEDGVVTVYAIGDKPILDYTMQAQITEVVV